MKKWTYEEITTASKTKITQLMKQAAARLDKDEVCTWRQWAYGVYLMWDGLTAGCQKAGDNVRMMALTEIVID